VSQIFTLTIHRTEAHTNGQTIRKVVVGRGEGDKKFAQRKIEKNRAKRKPKKKYILYSGKKYQHKQTAENKIRAS
jgi:hypothetical protein